MNITHSQNNHPKVSIIVPIYNARKRLIKCLDTLVNQTLKEIEIILVLDCPTDGSDKIAKQYAQKDNRIIIIENSTNLHIGKTRNRGLEVAKGEYIGFSDHDDYRELDMYEKLYEEAKRQEFDVVLTPQQKCLKFSLLNKKNIIDDLISFGNVNSINQNFVFVTTNIYKRDFIKKNKIQFVDTKEITPEDLLFQLDVLLQTDKVIILNTPFYHHSVHKDCTGLTNDYTGSEKRIKGVDVIFNSLHRLNLFETYSEDFMKGVTRQFLQILSSAIIHDKNPFTFFHLLKIIKKKEYTNNAFQTSKYLPKVKNKKINILFRKILLWLIKF